MTGSEPRSAEAVHAVHRRVEELLSGVPADADGVELDALRAVGALSVLQPARTGGIEAGPTDFFRIVRSVSAACASTGWLLAQYGVGAWLAAQFAEPAQREVWGRGASQRIAIAGSPWGRLTRTGEAYLLSGRWRRCPGAADADWVILAAVECDPQGRPLDALRVLVPRETLSAEELEPEVGLHRVRSQTLIAHDVEVPRHRLLRTYDLNRLRAPGRVLNQGPLFGLPWAALWGHAATAPLLGAVEGAVVSVAALLRAEADLSLGRATDGDAPLQVALAATACDVEASVLQMEASLDLLYAVAGAGETPPLELRVRARRDQARAGQRASAGVDALFARRAGLPQGGRLVLERVWRDVHTLDQHPANQEEAALRSYGSVLAGRQLEDDLH